MCKQELEKICVIFCCRRLLCQRRAKSCSPAHKSKTVCNSINRTSCHVKLKPHHKYTIQFGRTPSINCNVCITKLHGRMLHMTCLNRIELLFFLMTWLNHTTKSQVYVVTSCLYISKWTCEFGYNYWHYQWQTSPKSFSSLTLILISGHVLNLTTINSCRNVHSITSKPTLWFVSSSFCYCQQPVMYTAA